MELEKITHDTKVKNIIDMAFTFTAMVRIFEKDSKKKICDKIFTSFMKMSEMNIENEYHNIHNDFCTWFIKNIKLAKKRNASIPRTVSYGQAAKIIDIIFKVLIHYCNIPDFGSHRISSNLNNPIDTPILNHLKRRFPNIGIQANTILEIDRKIYKRLQDLIKQDIQITFQKKISPVQYDDIMWNQLNRKKGKK